MTIFLKQIVFSLIIIIPTIGLFAQNNGDTLTSKPIETVKENETTEILLHPGFFDRKLLEMSSLNFERARDLALAIDTQFATLIQKMGFSLVSYEEIVE